MIRGKDVGASRVQSLDRGLTILQVVANSRLPVSLNELAVVLEIHRSSAFRLANTLKRRGFLASPSGRKDYILGPSMWRLAKQYNWGSMLIKVSRELLGRLAAETDETAHIAIREGTQAHVIDHDEASHVIVVSGQTGARFPLHSSSLGKALLADATESDLMALYGPQKLRQYTKNTITNIKDLARVCEQTRRDGYAIDSGEHRLDLRCVAAPIRAADGTIIASIGIAAPYSRLSDVRCRSCGKTALRIARQIGALLKNIEDAPKREQRVG